MKIYFAGAVVPYSEAVLRHGGEVLLSYADSKAVLKFWESYPKQKIFLDSGAFTAFTMGKQINLDEYIDFIKKNRSKLITFATLDVIGDWQATIKNTEYMENKGLNPLPVFHYDSPRQELERLIKTYDYIALGGLVPLVLQKNKLKDWLDYCFSIIKTKVRVHGLGMTSTWVLERYPFFTVDSTSYLQSSRFGSSHYLNNPKILHFNNKTKHYLERTEIEVKGLKQKEKRVTKLWESRGIKWN